MKRLLWVFFIFCFECNASWWWCCTRPTIISEAADEVVPLVQRDEDKAFVVLATAKDQSINSAGSKAAVTDRSVQIVNECSICFEILRKGVRTLSQKDDSNVCGHQFHEPCLRDWEQRHTKNVRSKAETLGQDRPVVIHTCPECATPYAYEE